nr:hypothetical protein [Tanacetum cinerariifolium]
KKRQKALDQFTKVIIHHFMMKKPSIPRRNKVNWHYVRDDILFSTFKVVSRHQNTQQYGAILPIELTTEDIRNTKAYKEYYACATGETAPNPKASARRKKGGSDSSTTPPTVVASPRPITIVAAAPRLTAAAKGKQPARATSPTDPSEEEESFDLIPRTPEDDEDDDNGKEDQGLRISEEERIQEEEEADELYRDVDINQGRGLQVSQDIEDFHVNLTLVHPDGQQESLSVSSFVTSMLNPTSNAGVESIFTTASSSIAPLPTPTPIMTPSTIATITTSSEAPIPPTIIPSAVLKNLPTFDSLFRFEDRVKSLKDPPLDQTGGRRDEEKVGSMNQLALYLNQQPEVQAGLQQGLNLDRCQPPRKPPTPDRDWNKTLPAIQGSAQTWISELAKQADSRSSFNELLDTPIVFSNFIMNRLCVDTLTPELLARPTYELMKGSCTSLTELEYHLEEVYKATTDQLD